MEIVLKELVVVEVEVIGGSPPSYSPAPTAGTTNTGGGGGPGSPVSSGQVRRFWNSNDKISNFNRKLICIY